MTKYALTVSRKSRGECEPYTQTFEYILSSESDTVATALRDINGREAITDIGGAKADPIEWECSCLQKKCGACAMIINGRPSLACDVKIASLGTDEIRLEPLRKFPVVADLIVDRSILFENLKTLNAWLSQDADLPERHRSLAYEASECIQCACCLEICPNFYAGGSFFGMSAGTVSTRLLSETDRGLRKELAKAYTKHIFEGCGKSLACKDICPRHIDTEKLLVNSNAMAIWKRR